jgi:murein DD-endopeptidase MepM/ murein hydrolase activator NlpD
VKVHAPTEFLVVTSHVGPRDGSFHDGLDLRARQGTAIKSFRSGTVVDVKRSTAPDDPVGKYVAVMSTDPEEIHKYFHMDSIDPALSVGQLLNAGDQFAIAGSTGNSNGPHLHFELHRRNGDGEFAAVNPIDAYPDHFGNYIDKETGEPVNIDRILKLNTRV